MLGCDQTLDPFGDLPGENLLRVGRGLDIDRLPPARLFCRQVRLDQRPKIDTALIIGSCRVVAERRVVGCQTLLSVPCKHRVDITQYRRGRAERAFQAGCREIRAHAFQLGLEMLAHTPERLGLRALERIDRLFLVTDDEDRAPASARALTREELGCDRGDDRPLRGCCVLSLVHQYVVDALIQLVEHPGAHVSGRQNRVCAAHEIFEIQQPALTFGLFQLAQQRTREKVKIPRTLGKFSAEQPFTGLDGPGGQVLKLSRCLRPGALDLLGGKPGFGRLSRLGQKPARQTLGKRNRIGQPRTQPILQQRTNALFANAAIPGKYMGKGLVCSRVEFLQCLPAHLGLAPCGRLAKMRGQPFFQVPRIQRRAFVDNASDQLVQRSFVEPAGRTVERHVRPLLGGLCHLLAYRREQRRRLAVVGNFEARRHPRLQRKPAQQGIAERVDCLDLEPARGLERPCEQTPGLGQNLRVPDRLPSIGQFGQLRGQLVLGRHRPTAQPGE